MEYQNKKYETLLLDIKDSIAVITFNRPEVYNASNLTMSLERAEILRGITVDPAVRVVVITGGNKMFSAGGDIDTMSKFNTLDALEFSKIIVDNQSLLHNLSKPTIAAVAGLALGGGLEQVLMCDIRIATESAKFGLPEINLGIFPGGGGTQLLPQFVSLCKAKEMILLGTRLSAKEALDLGIINRIVPEETLLDEAMNIAKELAKKSPDALSAAKMAINSAWGTPTSVGLRLESYSWVGLYGSENQKEGMNAFLEKREADFK